MVGEIHVSGGEGDGNDRSFFNRKMVMWRSTTVEDVERGRRNKSGDVERMAMVEVNVEDDSGGVHCKQMRMLLVGETNVDGKEVDGDVRIMMMIVEGENSSIILRRLNEMMVRGDDEE